eukprot:CAMPEP_0202002314 /NCGR_PEP_ID=MMETSP0905-20130828/8172_1 /ASSEMBLY_ACC=CAM_ASM_000554 /TAXON_ID=420261 /ORGANISM="Thalassiosira antarctica, Strain CCMP982" /LENGTH=307 /DNA_ID=CAMNT_0048559171 /DNA_START=54 /DNA_END=977 /DNA_ORIENTATION=+
MQRAFVFGSLPLLFFSSFSASFIPKIEVQPAIRHMERLQNLANDDDVMIGEAKSKRIVFIRHGRTYMNEYIGGINYGTPNFTDIFPDTSEYTDKYPDSPLSPVGHDQVKKLNSMIRDLKEGIDEAKTSMSDDQEDDSFLNDLDLVVVSPLTRALQTLEIGLYQHIQERKVPIMALPLATERVYLVSDIGKNRSELKKRYGYIDFDTAFLEKEGDEPWWFTPSDELADNYVEWRPSGEGQTYACLGEPQDYFDRRMSDLYLFLRNREETTIAVVCHAGVIDWFVQDIFENCELRVVPFDNLKPRGLME